MRRFLLALGTAFALSLFWSVAAFAEEGTHLHTASLLNSQDYRYYVDPDFCGSAPNYPYNHSWQQSYIHHGDCTAGSVISISENCIYCNGFRTYYYGSYPYHRWGWRTENATYYNYEANSESPYYESFEQLDALLRSLPRKSCETYKCYYGCNNIAYCNVSQGEVREVTYHAGYKNRTVSPTKYSPGGIYYECQCGADKTLVRTLPKQKLTKLDKSALKTLSAFFGQAKKYNVNGMNKLFSKNRKSSFYSPKELDYKYCKKYNKYLKYQMVDIKSFEKTAKAKLKVTYVSIADNYRRCYKAYEDWIDDKEDTFGPISQKSKDKAWKRFMVKGLPKDIAQNGSQTKTCMVNLTLKKSKGGWRIANFPDSLNSALNDN